MKIGLTGGTGFIGQHFVKEYADGNTFVVATAHEMDGSYFQHKNIAYVLSDYSERSYREIFDGCSCIIHLGAKRFTPENEKRFSNYLDNVISSENVFEAASALGIQNIVNISTTSVYSPSQGQPYKEEKTFPLNFYGASKLCVEKMSELYNKKRGLRIKTLRLAQVLGLGERGGFLLAVYLENALRGKTLDVYGRGISAKEYIYIKDVTAAIMKACLKPELSGPFNIGSGVSTTNLELAKSFCKVFENPEGYRLLTDKKEDGLSFLMDVTLAAEQLGFCTQYSLESALADMKKELEGQDK